MLFCVNFLIFAAISSSAVLDSENFRLEYQTNLVQILEVTRPGAKIYVPNVGLTYEVGDRLPLFQKNHRYYIAGVPRFDGSQQLVAFPLKSSRKESTGWVTNDKYLIFAERVSSVGGELELDLGFELDVLDEQADHMEALLLLEGRLAVVRIPRGAGGFTLSTREVLIVQRVPVSAEDRAVHQVALEQERTPQPRRPSRRISVTIDDEGMIIQDEDGNEIASNAHGSEEEKLPQNTPLQAARIEFLRPEALAESASPTHEMMVAELKEVVMLEIMEELQRQQLRPDPVDPVEPDNELTSIESTAGVADATPVDVGPGPERKKEIVQGGRAVPGGQEASGVSSLVASIDPQTTEAELEQVAGLATDSAAQVLETSTVQAASFALQERDGVIKPPIEPEQIVVNFLSANSLMFQILLLVALVEAFMLFRMRRMATPIATGTVSGDGQAYSYFSADEPSLSRIDDGTQAPLEDNDLHGTLDGFSMGQVVQFFHSSGDSGILTVSQEGGEVETMTFCDGHIVDAESGPLKGETAANQILRRHKGTFVFKRQDTNGHGKCILQDTMSLLLEAHRMVDEHGYVE